MGGFRSYDGIMEVIVFIVAGGLLTSLMVNAPAIFLGYGFAYLVMLLAAWLFKPKKAFIAVLGASIFALPFMILPESVFVEVAILNVIVRPLVTYPASLIRWKWGLLPSALSLTAFETLSALTIAIFYYGDDGIHTAFSIFGITMIPFGYAIYLSLKSEDRFNRILRFFASSLSALIFYFSLITFPEVILALLSITAAFILIYRNNRFTSILLTVILIVGLFYGSYSQPFRDNLKTALYPFNPENWNEKRWIQKEDNCEPSDNVFEYTHSPSRLKIVHTCAEVTGIVEKPPFIAGDGDYCFDIKPDEDYKYMLGVGNYILRKGGLHIEVVPHDHIRVLSSSKGICPGDKVRVKGVWIIDTDHGMWTEVHPAFEIELINGSEKRWPDCVMSVQFEE